MTNRIRLRIADDNRLKRRPLLVAMLLILLPSAGFAGNFIAFGPQSYTRSSGSPVTVTNNFTILNPASDYMLRIHNGGLEDSEFEKVSSSVISLNGVQVAGPSEFNQNVTLIEKPVTLATNNELEVELRGKPGGGITIQIVGVDDDPPTVTITSPANGATVNASPVIITGTVGDATSGIADVTCNETPAIISGSSFSCDVSLVDGPNTILVEATDLAGNVGSSSITVNLATGLTVTITSPAPGSVINASSVIVQGVVDAPLGTELGVTVNGVVAEVNGGEFAALVPVEFGDNTITARVVDTAGDSGIDSVIVDVPVLAEEPLRLLASPSKGLNPLTVELRASSILKKPIVFYELDFEGDGAIDFSSATFDSITHTYIQERLFFPTLTVTDDVGNQISTSAIVNVFTPPDLVAKWNAMKDTLRIGDIDTALSFIAEESRDRYRGIFTTVSSELPSIDSILTDIRLIAVRRDEAEFSMLRTSADGVERSFFILFVRDNDGIWRLRVF